MATCADARQMNCKPCADYFSFTSSPNGLQLIWHNKLEAHTMFSYLIDFVYSQFALANVAFRTHIEPRVIGPKCSPNVSSGA